MKRLVKPVLIGVGILTLLCVVVAIIAPDQPADTTQTVSGAQTEQPAAAAEKPTRTPKPTKTPVPTETPKPLSEITFAEIRAQREALTDAQWDAYAKPLEGLRVQWTGYVEEVKSNGEIWIDMDAPDAVLSVQDCYIKVPAEDALKYNKDQELTWQGDIRSVTSLLGSVSVRFEAVAVQP